MPDELSIQPGASEAEVAETIVSARKSWKTVKGKSEPVWPPTLEKALVKALLQYKPTDSRYARALGRFPKRNRFISDYIYEHTGQRRTPKQVGSRLQQLKDVNCGKQLLSHVASWSLGPGPTPPAPSGMDGLDFSSQQQISINPMSGISSDCTPSPSSPFPHMRTPFGSDQTGLSPLTTSFYSPASQYSSLPVTPQIRRLDVFLPYDAAALQSQAQQQQQGASHLHRGSTLMRFSGCLALPETVQAESETPSSPPSSAGGRAQRNSPAQGQPAVIDREPRVTFTARGPIAASSVVSIWVEGGPADDGSGANMRTAHRETSPLVCVGTPSISQSYSAGSDDEDDEGGQQQHQLKSTRSGGRSHQQQQTKQSECFSYSTQLVSNAFWENMRRDTNLSKYTIQQDLVYQLDTSTARPGDSFLTIVYRFVPTSTPSSSPITQAGQILAMRTQGSASPGSSSSSSTSSASPASVYQLPLHQSGHQQHQYLQQQHQHQHQMVSHAMYAANHASQLAMGLPAHIHNQMLPPMMGLTSSSCSSTSSNSSHGTGMQPMSRHGSPLDHLASSGYAMLQPSPCGSPLSTGFPSLSHSGMTPTHGFDDDFGVVSGASMGLGSLGVNVNDFGFNTSPGHGSPLPLA